jgi:autotransporter-associated beta strand protein
MRQMLSVSWIGGPNGYWDVAANWSGGVVPTSSTAVSIATSGATVTIKAGETESAASLSIAAGAALAMPGGGDPSNPTSNLITNNAGFESPVAHSNSTRPSGWDYFGSTYLSTQYAFSGSQSLVVSGQNSGAYQIIAVTPGDTYTMSVYAMMPAGNPLTGNISAGLQLLYFDSSGDQISSYSPPNNITLLNSSSATGGPLPGSVGNQGWNYFFTTAVAPANAATAHVQLVSYSAGGAYGGAAYFDAVAFGPAPAGASTLTTGSLANSGTLTIGPLNSIAVSGGFTQTSTGTLDVQLGGAPSTGIFSSLTISGTAALAGTLQAQVVYSYSPSTADTFTPISYNSESGSFASSVLPGGTGYQFAAAVTFTNVTLSAEPTTALTATVNAATDLHAVTTNLLGINMAYWDPDIGTTQTQQLLAAAGLDIYRFPGGSSSDDYHFNVADNYYSGADTFAQFVQTITADGGMGLVTLDYGSGSPQEAAAELAYLDGSPGDTTSIGNGIEWNDSVGQWQTVNWGTVGYWAALRGAAPLATDDGLNFLRIVHPAPFTDVKYWEVGNEEYGSWETDHHGTATPGSVSTGAQHDPATYAAFAAQFASLAHTILTDANLPLITISIGIDSGDPTGASDNDWTENVLAHGLADGFVPGFISDHSYMQAPGAESDSILLDDTVSDSGSIDNWTTRYADYETVLQETLGSQASSVQVMATEYNSVYTDPGKQSTSLVNGLFEAESLGSLLDSGYSGGFVWDLRNGWGTTYNNSNLLYGWREGGDYGLLGSSGVNSPPATGPYVAYPGYYAFQLASKILQSGGQVVPAASNYGDLDVYAVMEPSGDLDLLVINVNPAASLTEQFDLTGFQPGGPVQVWQYGKVQDTAQSRSTSGKSALADLSRTLSLSGSDFSYAFPAYSMTVLDLTPAPPVITPGAANPSPERAQWVSAVAAAWTTQGDWQDAVSGDVIAAPGVRGITGDTVLVGPSAAGDIDLDGVSPSLAAVTFSGTSGSTIAQGSGGSLLLNNGTSPALLTVSAGTHTIGAPIVLDSNVTLLAAAGSQLTIAGGLSGAGCSLTVGAPGTVVFSGASSYTGGTTVAVGTLVVTNPSAIPASTSLTIGAGGTFVFDPSFVAAPIDTISAFEVASPATSRKASVTIAAPVAANLWPNKKSLAIHAVDAVFAQYGR